MSSRKLEAKRKNFTVEQVKKAYEVQGHACAHCGIPFPLEMLAQDHRNGKRDDNSDLNCQLLCRIGHYKETEDKLYAELREKQLDVRTILTKAIEDIAGGKITGAEMERILEASKEIEKLDRFRLEFPAEFQAQADERRELEKYVEGFKEGLRIGATKPELSAGGQRSEMK